LFLFLLLFSCSKEVKIDIPGYEQQLVVDGNIEAGGHPIVILSQSANIYSESYITSYVNSFVSDADVKVVVDNDTFQLDYILSTDLPISSQKKLAEMLRIELVELLQLPIRVYSSTQLVAQAEKTYELIIDHQGKKYNAKTYLPAPTPLLSVYWKLEPETGEYGYSWAKLQDPPGQFDAYKWEVRRINKKNGEDLDLTFRRGFGAYREDKYFDGLTFEFFYENPLKRKDTTHLEGLKRYYRIGDSVVVKFSKMDKRTYEFFDKKSAQMESSDNPYSTPINIPTNMTGGALGIWAGFSPWYDTLYCQP
jgi:hemin uptake protein HemP